MSLFGTSTAGSSFSFGGATTTTAKVGPPPLSLSAISTSVQPTSSSSTLPFPQAPTAATAVAPQPLSTATAAAAPAAAPLFPSGGQASTGPVNPLGGAGLGGSGAQTIKATGEVGGAARDKAQTPRETKIPPELQAILGELEAGIKANKEAADEISLAPLGHLHQTREEIHRNGIGLGGLRAEVASLNRSLDAVKVLCGEELRGGEFAERRSRTVAGPTNPDHSPTAAVKEAVAVLETGTAKAASSLGDLERLLSAALNPSSEVPSFEELSAHLKRMEETFSVVAARCKGADSATKELRKRAMRLRRAVFGTAAGDPFRERKKETWQPRAAPLEPGPNPFSPTARAQQAALAAAAKPTSSLTSSMKPSIPSLNFSSTTPFASTTAAAKPSNLFGSTPATNAASFKPFGTPATTASTPAPFSFTGPKTFSNSFNSAASGTLFSSTTKSALS